MSKRHHKLGLGYTENNYFMFCFQRKLYNNCFQDTNIAIIILGF